MHVPFPLMPLSLPVPPGEFPGALGADGRAVLEDGRPLEVNEILVAVGHAADAIALVVGAIPGGVRAEGVFLVLQLLSTEGPTGPGTLGRSENHRVLLRILHFHHVLRLGLGAVDLAVELHRC